MRNLLDLYRKEAQADREVFEWCVANAAELVPDDLEGRIHEGFRQSGFARMADVAYQAESHSCGVSEYYDALEFWSGAAVSVERKRDRDRKRVARAS